MSIEGQIRLMSRSQENLPLRHQECMMLPPQGSSSPAADKAQTLEAESRETDFNFVNINFLTKLGIL